MKAGHVYHANPPKRAKKKRAKKNPVPFAMVTANPKKRRAKTKRRNPAKARASSPGVFVIRKPTKKNPVSMKTKRRRHAKKRRNPLVAAPGVVHCKRNPKRRRKHAKKRSGFASLFSSRNPMAKTRRSGKKRRHRKNPARSGGYRRNARRQHRRRSHRRNPVPVVRELFAADNLSLAAGVVTGAVGARTVINFLQGADATGNRRFSLPGVNYTNAANPTLFYQQNGFLIAAYELAIAGLAGWALKGQSPRLARGIMLGGLVAATTDILTTTGIISGGAFKLMGSSGVSSRGTGAYLRAPRSGMGALTPGVSPTFTGPGAAFLNGANGAPMSRGLSRRVGPNQARDMVAGVPNFANPN
jgi:hypothetical protein